MADNITNGMLLEHMQGMKNDLQQQIANVDKKLTNLIKGVEIKLTEDMTRGFEEARQHRQALQEDLEETMRVLSQHGKKLARL